MFTKYNVEMTFIRPVLGTNPIDPAIHDQHILQKQRKLITENSKNNKDINKYLDALQITDERGQDEVEGILNKLEEIIGRKFSTEERKLAIKGELESLRETLQEQELKGVTVFFRHPETKKVCIGDHMIKGFMKAAAEAVSRTKPKKNGTMLHSASYTESVINQHACIDESFIEFDKDIERKEDGSPLYKQRSLLAQTAMGPRVTLAKSEEVPAGAKLKFTLKVMTDSPLTEEVLNKLFSYGEISGIGQWRNARYGAFNYELSKLQ